MKSIAELETIESIKKIEQLINDQEMKVGDANQILKILCKLLNKCEELRKSRDNHRYKKELVELKLKKMINTNCSIMEKSNE